MDQNCYSEVAAAERQAIVRLCEVTGHSSPFDAMVARARVLLAEFGQLAPPFDPEQMAGLQGITRVDRADITFDACLIPVSDGFRVKVCKYHARGRQNFSIAHEIAHTFLIELEPSLGCARREVNVSDRAANSELVEQLCDAAASELIWPTYIFQRDAWDARASLGAVLSLANRYEASVTATARRFAEVGPWRCGFVIWEAVATGDRVKLRPKSVYRSSDAALPGRGRLVAAEGSQFYRALECDHVVKGRESLDTTGRRLYAETAKLGQGAISMVIFEPYPEIVAAEKPLLAQRSLFR